MEPEMGVRWPQAEKRRQLPTVVLQETLESPLDSKEIKLVNPKGNQPWICIGKTDAEAEAPIRWPPDVKSWLIRKDPSAGKDWRQEEGNSRGWDGWMASPTRWTWVWASSGRWWGTRKSGVLQSMGSQRVRQDWATEQQQGRGCVCFTWGSHSSPWIFPLITSFFLSFSVFWPLPFWTPFSILTNNSVDVSFFFKPHEST